MSGQLENLNDSIKAFKDAIMAKLSEMVSNGGGSAPSPSLDISQSTLIGTLSLTEPVEYDDLRGFAVSPTSHRIYVVWDYFPQDSIVQQYSIDIDRWEGHLATLTYSATVEFPTNQLDIVVAPDGKCIYVTTLNPVVQIPMSTPFDLSTLGTVTSVSPYDNDLSDSIDKITIDDRQTTFINNWAGRVREVRMQIPGNIAGGFSYAGVLGPKPSGTEGTWPIDFADRGNSLLFLGSHSDHVLYQVPLKTPYSGHTAATTVSSTLAVGPNCIGVRTDLSSHFIYILKSTNEIAIYRTNIGAGT